MKRLFAYIVTILVVLIPLMAGAMSIEKRLDDPAQELRAMELFKQVRCMVCTGESIHDSQASLAKDLRFMVRERIAAGDDDKTILGYLSSRYGDAILMEPPVRPSTWLLWFGPAVLLVLGLAVMMAYIRKLKRFLNT